MKFISLAVLATLVACTDKGPGRLLAQGLGRGLVVAQDGGAVAFLLDARHPDDRQVPEDLYAGDLWLAATGAGSASRKVGEGVSSAEGSYRFSPGGGALAFLTAWRFRAGAGELWVAPAQGGEPRKLADEAQSFAWSPKGERLGYVAAGRLLVAEAAGGAPRLLGEGVQSFAWSPDGAQLAARAPSSAGGQLWLVDAKAGSRRTIAERASDYAFAPDGALGLLGAPGPKGGDRPLAVLEPGTEAPRELGRATAFAFAPTGRTLLALSTAKAPGEATGDLLRLDRAGAAAQELGAKAADFVFAPSGDALFLARYDLRSRAGTLSLAPAAGGAVRAIAPRVQGFTLGPQGRRVFFLVQAPSRGDYKLELWTADLAAPGAPRKIDDGVYGYEPSPDGALLYWKARCAMGPRSCSLFRAPVDGSAAPVDVANDVAGFDLSRDGNRLLLASAHHGSHRSVDLSWLPSGAPGKTRPSPIAADVDPSARFLDAQGTRTALAVLEPGKAGVYLAEIR